jgi:hypothetical protein
MKAALSKTAELRSAKKAIEAQASDEELKIPSMPGKLDMALEAAVN